MSEYIYFCSDTMITGGGIAYFMGKKRQLSELLENSILFGVLFLRTEAFEYTWGSLVAELTHRGQKYNSEKGWLKYQ